MNSLSALAGIAEGVLGESPVNSAYLTDEDDHNVPHLMFFTAVMDAKDWGSGAAGSPVMSAPYWFSSSKEPSQMKGLPPIPVFLVVVADWPDGTPAGKHQE